MCINSTYGDKEVVMKREDIVGRKVTVVYGRGESYKCFVAGWDRKEGITLKLLDPNDAPKYWGKREEDGSHNAICLNKNDGDASYKDSYNPFFDHITAGVLRGVYYTNTKTVRKFESWGDCSSMSPCAF